MKKEFWDKKNPKKKAAGISARNKTKKK